MPELPELVLQGPLTGDVLVWRLLGTVHVTLILKAAAKLVHGQTATLAQPEARDAERYARGPMAAAADRAPQKGRADVTLSGFACAPSPVATAAARLALFQGERPILDRTIHVFGDRTRRAPAPRPFTRMPLVLERSYGGPRVPANPLGAGSDDARPDAPLPNLVDPEDPLRPAAMVPVPGDFPVRARLLGDFDSAHLLAPTLDIPSPRILGFFQCAPPVQQVARLQGDEWVVLDGMHPSLPRVQSRLPGMRPVVEAQMRGVSRQLAAALDTLHIDAEALTATLTFRCHFPLVEGQQALSGLRLTATFGPAAAPAQAAPKRAPSAAVQGTAALSEDQQAQLAEARATPFGGAPAAPAAGPKAPSSGQEPPHAGLKAPPSRPEPPSAPAAPKPGAAPPAPPKAAAGAASTRAIDPALLAQVKQGAALPFGAKSLPAGAPPAAIARPPAETPALPPAETPAVPPVQTPALPPVQTPALPPVQTPRQTPVAASSTQAIDPSLLAQAREGAPLPFAPATPGAAPSLPPAQAPRAPRTGALTGTAALSDVDLAALRRAEPLPFVPPETPAPAPVSASPADQSPPRGLEGSGIVARKPAPPFRRKTPGIPVVSDAPLTVATMAWQVKPPRDSITVIAKASFDIVPGEDLVLRAEPDALTGDVYTEDDPEKGLLAASDFAVFKPLTDVVVTGHAYPGKGASTTAHVSFRFGSSKGRIDRSLFVFGDRAWKGTLVAPTPGDPAPFEKMALVHERAFGGPGFEKNPVGAGFVKGGAPARLPNLEHPQKILKKPTDTPDPVCFAPIAPAWKARAAKLGTYDRAWLETRWPFFPEDFDYHHFQHAPEPQQCAYPAGDERFELAGMHPVLPLVEGRLPGLRARVFAEKIEGEKSTFFEIPVNLDSVTFDADGLRAHLVWRGLVEVKDEQAPEINVLFATLQPVSDKAYDLAAARAAMTRALTPPEPPPAAPPPPVPPANDTTPEAPEDPEIARIEAEVADRQVKVREALKAAGFPDEDPPPPPPGPPDLVAMATLLQNAGHPAEDVEELLATLQRPPPDEAPDPQPEGESARARAERLLAEGASLDGVDLAGGDLSGLDFSGRSMKGALLKGARLRTCRMAGADLTEAQLGGADLTGADLTGATLDAADLTGATLADAVLTEASLTAADLTGAQAERLKADRVKGVRCSFANARLQNACFDGAELPGLDLSAAALDGASFQEATIPEVRLYDAEGRKVRFDRAILTGGRVDAARLADASFRGASAEESEWEGAVLTGATFHSAKLAGAGLSRVAAEEAIFSGADLREARLRRAKLRGAHLLKANLMQATLERADLSAADLRGANLYGAETWKAKLDGAKLDAALTARSKLEDRTS